MLTRLRDFGRGFAMGFVFYGAMVALYRMGYGHLPGLAGWLAFFFATIVAARWAEMPESPVGPRRHAAPSGLYNSRGTQ